MMAAAQIDWYESMSHAMAINDPYARKAAVDELVANYKSEPPDTDPPEPAAVEDADGTGDDAATTEPAGDTPTPDDAYAVDFLNSGPSDGTPDGQPPNEALPGPLAVLERQRSETEIAALEVDIARALEATP